ncbi:MAG TPA: alcohol dehydrogenase catalytic domain-containing protein [Candidatus Brocadiia bacterium]|nr:alcohol dehydrogenase catalytic domain-containing protein [Candidatus Brocadiales bacterium]
MKALRKVTMSAGLDLVDIPIPSIAPVEVLVKIRIAPICGTDVDHIYPFDESARNFIKKVPVTIGHEFCGEIVEVGSAVRNFKVGDYVSAESHLFCDKCYQCKNNQRHLCQNMEFLGGYIDGTFAEYVALPEKILWKNSPELPPKIAALQESCGNSVYCTLIELIENKNVLIYGDGPTALFACAVARTAGAEHVIIIGHSDFRLEIAVRVGADVTFNSKLLSQDKITDAIRNRCGDSGGVDVVLCMVGDGKAINHCFELTRNGGDIRSFGIPTTSSTLINWDMIRKKGLTVHGIYGRLIWDTWKQLNGLFGKGLNIAPIVTHEFKLEDYEKAFALMSSSPKQCGEIAFNLEL